MDSRNKRNIQPFNGERYSTWKFRIKSLLEELQVLSVINSATPKEPDAVWRKKNRIAKGTIVEYLGDAFLNFAKESATAKTIFEELDKIYERRSLATQLALRKQLLNLKLQPDVSLLQHFTKFDNLITELISAGARLDEMDKISHLLLTLPTSYDGVITALETLAEEQLNLVFVKTRLLDHEVKLKAEPTTELKALQTGNKHFGAKNSSSFYKNNRTYPQKKNYYQPGNSMHKISKMFCDHCGRRNHFKKDCRYFKKLQQNNQSANFKKSANNIESCNNDEDGFAFMISKCKLSANYLENDTVSFLLDSGATDHIVNSKKVFTSYVELPTPLKIGVAKNGASILAFGKGRIEVTTNLNIQGSIDDVLYSPEVRYNLLSVNRIQQTGMSVNFGNNGVKIYGKNNKCFMTGDNINNLFSITFKINNSLRYLNLVKESHQDYAKEYKLWHGRLGHLNKQKINMLKNVVDENDSKIFDNLVIPSDELCEPCILGKQARLPFAKSKDKSNNNNRPLFIIHSDVCGPIKPSTVDDKNYFVTFIDDFTHYTVTYLMYAKSEVLKCFQDFVAKSENLFNHKVTNLYCDNGREYLSNEFKDYCVCKGITYHLTVPYTPQQNGVSERMNRTLTEMARTLVTSAKLSKIFWGEAILTSTYLTNRLPTKALSNNKTPYEMWHNKKPKISHLRIFGSTAYVHDKTKVSKFDEKSFKAILVGYDQNGYKLFNTENNQFLIARDVVFDELNFESSRLVTNVPVQIPAEINKPDNDDKSAKLIGNKHKNNHSPENSSEAGPSSSKLRRSERILKLPSIDYKKIDDPDFYLSLTTVQSLPCTYDDIFNRDDSNKWLKAIESEIESIHKNNTWTLVERPNNVNIISSKWVFTIKNNELGEPTRYKARLVARGFTQQYLEDYDETFAPVARISTFRFILALANQFDLHAHHMDVKTAFLNGILKEDIYMEVPKGVSASSNQVCKLNKTLYGLKQSSRCWFERFDHTLKDIGFKNSGVDPCLYILDKNSVDKNVYIVLYVDDLIICTKDIHSLKLYKNCLLKEFSMTDLQEIKLFLGIKVERCEGKLTLDQSLYLNGVLSKFSMSDCNPSKSPFPSKLDYNALNSDTHYDAPCRNVIGCLMYAMLCTRPDICAAIGILSRYQSKNNEELWKCLKHLLRYIKGTVNLKLTYVKCDYKQLVVGYADSDWGGDVIDRKSTTGHVFKVFDNCAISWNTRKQNTVAASSTEAEYMALFEAVREAIWLKSLLHSISIPIKHPIIIYEDNNSCISIANNPTNHKRSKHIDIKYHFTREQIANKVIKLEYISTGDQLADIFTKMVHAAKFLELRHKLNLI